MKRRKDENKCIKKSKRIGEKRREGTRKKSLSNSTRKGEKPKNKRQKKKQGKEKNLSFT